MMQAFRKMLYSDTAEEAQKALNSTLDVRSIYPKWQKYVYNCTLLGIQRALMFSLDGPYN